jgi:putative ABC transport system permease protein
MNTGDNRNQKNRPPKWAKKLLELFCAENLYEELDGDLLEEYNYQLKHFGPRKASWDYVMNVISFIHPFARRRRDSYHHTTPIFKNTMWRNYLITAVRNFSRHRTYSFLNLAGLTLGLVSSMLIFQYVILENSADSFHTKKDHLYRVAFNSVANGGTPATFSQVFLGAGEAFKAEIPAVNDFTRIRADFFQEGPTIIYTSSGDKQAFKDVRSIIVDSTFLRMFSFPLVKGNSFSALASPNSVLITESMAQRIFGDNDPIGKTVDYSMNQGVHSLQVAGIMKDVPANSHIQFDLIIPLQHHLGNIPESARQYYSAWNFKEFTTYVELLPETNVEKVEAMMTKIIDRNVGVDLRQSNTTLNVQLQPMKSLYFDRQTNLGLTGFGSALVNTRTGNERMVYFFTLIAIVTIGIALISYINLSTVRSLDRAREVGIRKVVGARKHQLKVQFFMESAFMNFAALIIATLLIMLLMPSFNAFVQTNFTLASWFNQTFLLIFGGVFVVGVLLSGLYPAFILSSFLPIVALKGKVGSLSSGARLRKLFVVVQYAPAIVLVVCTIVVFSQLDFMRRMDVGLEMNKLITIRSPRFLPSGMESFEAESSFKNEIGKLSTVAGASFAGNQAGRGLNFLVPFVIDSANDAGLQQFKGSGVDHDFANVFGLKLLAGEPFTDGMSPRYGDPNEFIRKVLVNETAVQRWGFKQNNDAVGRLLTSADGSRYYVQGVLEDFNWASVHHATDPVMLWYTPNNRFMTIKLTSGVDLNKALTQIRGVYDKLFPTDVFHYEFAEDVYNKQYGEDEKFANLFGIFSAMAVLIASLGLFGLSAFSAERRSREVGIRKVMGANVNQIVRLLSKEFILLVFVAFVIASPIAWVVMNQWLESFAFRIDLNALPFIIAAIGSVLIAIVSVSVKSISVANTNPVDTLRTE